MFKNISCVFENVQLRKRFFIWILLHALSKTLLASHVELKPFQCFMWSYSNKLEILLLCVRSGWNRILIALVHLRQWKAKWIFHILDSRSSIVVLDALQESSFSKTKSCVSFVFQVRKTQLYFFPQRLI